MDYNVDEPISEVQKHEDWVEHAHARGSSEQDIYDDGHNEDPDETKGIIEQVESLALWLPLADPQEDIKNFGIGLIVFAMIMGYIYYQGTRDFSFPAAQ